MKTLSSNFLALKKNVLVQFIIFLLLYSACFTVVFYATPYKELPTEFSIVRWDAEHYQEIKNSSYRSEKNVATTAFFPAFPYAWKFLSNWLGTGNIGISIMNFIFFFMGFLIFAKSLKTDNLIEFLLVFSSPCLFFVYVPYSEGLFYLFSAITLYGLNKNNLWVACVGLFFASTTRSIFVFVVPCIIMAEMLSQQHLQKKIKNIFFMSVSACLGLFSVIYLQWQQTGRWFAFIHALKKWGTNVEIGFLKIPFYTWDKQKIMFIDLLAVWVGIISGIWLSVKLLQYLMPKINIHPRLKNVPNLGKVELFSLTYLFLVAFFALFVKKEFVSSGRYTFATVFYSVFVLYVHRNYLFSKFSFTVAVGIYILLSLLTVPYPIPDNQILLYRLGLTLLVLLSWFGYFYLKSKKYRLYLIFSIITANVLVQAYLFERFIANAWSG
ncbi:MAG: hypothetical protein NZ455_16520 [Bacteroidia bacterium]|nr:hypothetical protein [Bacteroidia bacterium]